MRKVLILVIAGAGLLGGEMLDARECTGVAANLVPSCGVADASEAAAWLLFGNGDSLVHDSLQGNPAGSMLGDAQDIGSNQRTTAVSACFPVSDATEYTAALDIRLNTALVVECLVGLELFSSTDCNMSGYQGQTTGSTAAVQGSFVEMTHTGPTQVGTQSARVSGRCDSTTDADFTINYDNAIAVPGDSVPVELQGFSVE